MFTLRQIRYFLAVADTAQVSAAATQLHISQSAITVAIKDLEDDLGVTLFQRRVGGMTLTKDGQNFVAYAREIEATAARALHSMRRGEAKLSGRIRLGATYTGLGYFLVPVLARFRRAYPNVSVEVKEYDHGPLERAVRDGEVDLAVMVVSNARQTPGLDFERRILLRSPRGLWLSSAHPLMHAPTVSLADIANEPYVQFTVDEAGNSAREYWAAHGLKPNVVFETASLEALRGMVAEEMAITVLALVAYRPWSLDGGRVEFRKLEDEIPTFDLGVVWDVRRPPSEIGRALLEHLESAVQSR